MLLALAGDIGSRDRRPTWTSTCAPHAGERERHKRRNAVPMLLKSVTVGALLSPGPEARTLTYAYLYQGQERMLQCGGLLQPPPLAAYRIGRQEGVERGGK